MHKIDSFSFRLYVSAFFIILNILYLYTYILGNEAIHDLTKNGKAKLRLDLKKFSGEQGNITYSTFKVCISIWLSSLDLFKLTLSSHDKKYLKVGSKSEKYKLTIGGFKGSLGMSKLHHFDFHTYTCITTTHISIKLRDRNYFQQVTTDQLKIEISYICVNLNVLLKKLHGLIKLLK